MNLYADNRLFADYLTDFERLAPFYRRSHRLSDLRAHVPAPTRRPMTPSDLTALADFNTLPFSDAAAVRSRVDRLADPETVCTLTGQQPGLFLGPLYTIFKAIHAIRLARWLERETGRAAVPVFWIGSEDHDFDEISRIEWLDGKGVRHSHTASLPAGFDGHSVGPMPIDARALEQLLDHWAATLPETEFRTSLFALLSEAITASKTIGDLFRHLLLRLFQPEGLIVIDPWSPAIKRELPGLLDVEVSRPGESTRQILAASERLRALGCEPQIHRRTEDVNFFLYVGGVRCKVTHAQGRFRTHHPRTGEVLEEHSADSLRALMSEHPERLSGNVATKPLVRDHVLQPIAYVAGPGEVGYYAQLRALYDHAGVPMPAIIPRVQAILLTPSIRRALKKLGLDAVQWLGLTEAQRTEAVARRGAGAALLSRFDEEREALRAQMRRLEAALAEIEPGLLRQAERVRQGLDTGLDRLTAQAAQAAEKRDELLPLAAARVREALLPRGLPQERVDNIFVPHMLMHGPSVVSRLLDSLDLDSSELQVLDLA